MNFTIKNNNFIIISGAKIDDIKKALNQWIVLYSDQFETYFDFEIYQYNSDSYLINPKIKLEFYLFNFLINYLYYPEDIEYNLEVVGYSLKNTDENIPSEFMKKDLLIYIPKDDKEGDNVYIITSDNLNYKINFGGKIKSVPGNVKFILPQINISVLDTPELLSTNSVEIKKIKDDKTNLSVKKRFKFLSSAVLILTFLSPLLSLKDSNSFSVGIFALGYAIGFWFYSDFKMLRINQYYFKSIIIASLYGLIGLLLTKTLNIENNLFTYVGIISPIWFLIIQRPIRFLFKNILKREPEVGNMDVSFGDKIYSVILFLCLFVLPFIFIMKYIG